MLSEQVAKELIAALNANTAAMERYSMGLPVVPTVPAVGATLTHSGLESKANAKMHAKARARHLLLKHAPTILHFLNLHKP